MLVRRLPPISSVLMATCLLAAVLSTAMVQARDPLSRKADSDAAKAKSAEEQEYFELFHLFADTFDQIERNYVKDVSRRRLMEAAIRGMLAELDPYSNYISPEDLDRFKAGVEAEFGGIGIQVSVDHGQLKVISPLVGTPAYRAGMMAGDVIIEIDGKSAKGLSVDEAVRRMKGKIGTELTLKVVHPGSEASETIKLRRETIHVQTVLGDARNGDDSWRWMYDDQRKIGYIRITGFARHTAEELRGALDALVKQDVRALVLDLRFNPGGLLSAAIEVSDMFIAGGRIVSTEGKNTEPKSYDAHAEGTYEPFPMAVLVNHYSASASEIVAACLQDHQRAVIVGERTWGKGSVQNIVQLEDGASALKLTTAGYRRPSGKNIHRFNDSKEGDDWGVLPDKGYQIKLSIPEMRRLHAYRRQKDIVRKPNGRRTGDGGHDAPPVDKQLQEAMEYLYEQLAKEEADGGAAGGKHEAARREGEPRSTTGDSDRPRQS